MKAIGLSRMIYELEFKLSADFTFQNSHVQTLTNAQFKKMFPFEDNLPESIHGIELPKRKERESEFGYLLIDSTFELKEYDSLTEGSAKIRPQLLIIHGILSFLTNQIFISFQNFASHQFMVSHHINAKGSKNKLVCEGVNFNSDLKKIFSEIETANSEKKILIYSLLERWRKALYLEIESEEGFVHLDESVLAYVHILEVLADEFKDNFKKKVLEERKQVITEILECASLPDKKSFKKISGLINKANELKITLKSKALQMLSDLDLYNPKSKEIVLRFIEHRNAIAHGRKDIYQDKVVYPLKPFFSLIKDIDENLESIKILSAKTISNYLGLNAWEDEWDFLMLTEFTPFDIVKDFIDNQKYITLSNKEFLNGAIDGIMPFTIAYYHLKGKISFLDLEQTLKNVFLTSKITKENCRALFNASVPLADSSIKDLADKARHIVQKVDKNRWGYYSNIRDIIKDYEYHGFTLKWFEDWLIIR
ncbi:MAG: hypothetical protein MH132_13050 [Hydrotalea sp.]|nr:hypothetical protein [Hydrotalea sp.]